MKVSIIIVCVLVGASIVEVMRQPVDAASRPGRTVLLGAR